MAVSLTLAACSLMPFASKAQNSSISAIYQPTGFGGELLEITASLILLMFGLSFLAWFWKRCLLAPAFAQRPSSTEAAFAPTPSASEQLPSPPVAGPALRRQVGQANAASHHAENLPAHIFTTTTGSCYHLVPNCGNHGKFRQLNLCTSCASRRHP